MKTGLILEGGAMRGMFTAAVMDVMMKNNINFDAAIGVSAGAAFGVNYKSKQIGRVIRYNTRFSRDKRYCGLYSLIKTGNYYSDNFCYKEVPIKHDVFDFDTFENNPMKFYVVCTDINTGKAVYKEISDRNDCLEWIRASSSMPIVSRIVKINDLELLDGGIADSIPIKYFESIGFKKNILILTQPKNYVKTKSSALSLIKMKYKNYPKLIEAMENRHTMYNETLKYIAKSEKEGKILVIRPFKNLNINRTEKDPKKLVATYNIGLEVAKQMLDEIKEFLK